MKTIAQIAAEIGVSKQAIHQRRKKEPLSTALQPFTQLIDGAVYIDVDGVNIIKQAFSKNEPSSDSVNVADNVYSAVDGNLQGDIVKLLQQNIDVLQRQLEIKDKQIEELTTTVKTQAESINFDRKNELAETWVEGQALLIGGEPPKQGEEKPKKKGFWGLFKK